jgi:hypothetical protein
VGGLSWQTTQAQPVVLVLTWYLGDDPQRASSPHLRISVELWHISHYPWPFSVFLIVYPCHSVLIVVEAH